MRANPGKNRRQRQSLSQLLAQQTCFLTHPHFSLSSNTMPSRKDTMNRQVIYVPKDRQGQREESLAQATRNRASEGDPIAKALLKAQAELKKQDAGQAASPTSYSTTETRPSSGKARARSRSRKPNRGASTGPPPPGSSGDTTVSESDDSWFGPNGIKRSISIEVRPTKEDRREYREQQRASWEEAAAVALVPPEYGRRQPTMVYGNVAQASVGEEVYVLGEVYHVVRDARMGQHLYCTMTDEDATFLYDAPGVAYSAPALWELMCLRRQICVWPNFVCCSIALHVDDLKVPINVGFAYPVRRPWNVASLVKLFRLNSVDMNREVERSIARAAFDHKLIINTDYPTWSVEFWDDERQQWLAMEAVSSYPHLLGSEHQEKFALKARMSVFPVPWTSPQSSEEYHSFIRKRLDLAGIDMALKVFPGSVRIFTSRVEKEATAMQLCPAIPPQRVEHLQVMFEDLCSMWDADLRRDLERKGGAAERCNVYTARLMEDIVARASQQPEATDDLSQLQVLSVNDAAASARREATEVINAKPAYASVANKDWPSLPK